MKKMILDTNIYEFILKHIARKEIENLRLQSKLIIYGNEVVRKELRAIGKREKINVGKELRSLRIALLTLYDFVTGKHQFETTKEEIILAGKYFVAYRSFGGIKSEKDIQNDFLIVACASLNGLDIVVSEDDKTMASKPAKKAYSLVNGLQKLTTPEFIKFEDFKEKLRGVNLD